MKLYELDERDLEDTGRYDPGADKINSRKLGDTRKPVLTLKDINKLKKLRAMRELDNAKRQDLLGIMYATADAEAGGGLGGF